MSRSDQERRDAERAARRARRLAERAELRAHRKADSARQAAERADRLAARAGARPAQRSREFEESLEDYVEHMTERFTRKATDWLDSSRSGMGLGDDYGMDEDGLDDDGLDDDGLGDGERRRSKASRAQRRVQRDENRRARHARRISWWNRFKSGRAFYRDKERGKVCGVCAGMADYLELETWQVRLAAVLGLVFVPSVVLPLYFILYFVMDDKPYYRAAIDRFDEAHDSHKSHKSHANYRGRDDSYARHEGLSASGRGPDRRPGKGGLTTSTNVQVLRLAREKFTHLEDRVRAIESHVTSSRFELQREFKKIAGEDL